jgi:glycosyltransferase involved in cell wall biosynthesis
MKENKKIAIVTTGHPAKDDRLYYRFAQSLQKAGISTTIITTLEDIQDNDGCIQLTGKKNNQGYFPKFFWLAKQLFRYKPDVMLCAEVFAVFPAFIYKLFSGMQSTIHLDITEWYPENILWRKSAFVSSILRPVIYVMMMLAGLLLDGYISGENKKLQRWLLLSPGKPNAIISYFPKLHNFPFKESTLPDNSLRVCFSGLFTEERGFFRFLELVKILAAKNPDKDISGIAVGKFFVPQDERKYNRCVDAMPDNLKITLHEWVPYEKLAGVYAAADIFVELRDDSFFYRNSLPIKIFEYMAMGRPVIYSENEAIKDVLDIEQVGTFVNPNALEEVAAVLQRYIDRPALLRAQGNTARKLAVEKFNWGNEEKKLLNYIDLF